MPNLDPWIKQDGEHMVATNKFENHLLSIRDERQKMIRPNCHPTYNERHQKIIEMIDWTLEKYKEASIKETHNEQVIIDNIIEELKEKRDIATQQETSSTKR